jgi:hypothetical protein
MISSASFGGKNQMNWDFEPSKEQVFLHLGVAWFVICVIYNVMVAIVLPKDITLGPNNLIYKTGSALDFVQFGWF